MTKADETAGQPSVGGGKFRTLEVLRAVAALGVVLFHTQIIFGAAGGALPFGGAFGGGHRGVELFFVLSGFIVTYVHAEDIGQPTRLKRYLFSRLSRVYPAVWIVSAVALLIYAVGFGGAEKAAKLSIGPLLDGILLLPQPDVALVNVTWTLKYEVFFYLLFSLLIVAPRLGWACLGLWQLSSLAGMAIGPQHGWSWTGFYLQPIVLEFGIGMGAAWLVRRAGSIAMLNRPAVQWTMLTTGLAAFLAGLIMEGGSGRKIDPFAELLLFGLGSGLTIVSLVLLESRGRIRAPRSLVRLGGASYAIYLVHFSVIKLVASIAAKLAFLPVGQGLYLASAGLGVAGGLAFDAWVDRPIQWQLRRRKAYVRPAAAVLSRSLAR